MQATEKKKEREREREREREYACVYATINCFLSHNSLGNEGRIFAVLYGNEGCSMQNTHIIRTSSLELGPNSEKVSGHLQVTDFDACIDCVY